MLLSYRWEIVSFRAELEGDVLINNFHQRVLEGGPKRDSTCTGGVLCLDIV